MKKLFLWMSVVALMLGGLMLSSCTNDNEDNTSITPQPTPTEKKAKWTVIVYGQTGAQMDALMESVFEKCKPLMVNDDVRLFFCYQYGKDEVLHGEHTFNAKYAKEGNVLFFELTKDTDLTTLVNDTKDGSTWSLTDPANMTEVINEVAKKAPAENYSLVIYGHGGGFDPTVDCPDNLCSSAARGEATRATLYDEWTQKDGGSGAMSMYNLTAAIKNSTVKLNTLFFHSCLMGNIECLSNVYTCADYIVSSAHVLVGVDCIMAEYIRALYEQTGTEKVISQMFTKMYDEWARNHVLDEEMELGFNGDMNLIKTADLPQVITVLGKLQKRIVELYPTQQEAIHMASDKVYCYLLMNGTLQMDMQDYANLLAANTGDEQLKAIADELKQALSKALLLHVQTINDTMFNIPEFSLSLVLAKRTTYARTYEQGYTYQQAYESSEFHKMSGWGDWLKINTRDVSRSIDGEGNVSIGDDDSN